MTNSTPYEFIRKSIIQHPNLSIKVHQGANHRILKSGVLGSIWIAPRFTGFMITATGSGISHLYREMEKRLGTHFREDRKGYKYWQVNDPRDIEEIIEIWSKN